MTTRRSAHLGTLMILFALASPLKAQSVTGGSPIRQGFHFSIGGGVGAAGLTCEGCDFDASERLNGFSGALRLGGAVTPNLVIAAEGTGWIKNEAPIERRIAAASVVALLYPSATSGFFLKAGVGYMRAVIEDDFGWVAADGIAPQLGLGFDLPVGGVWVTPYVTALRSTNSSLEVLGYNLPITLDPFIVQTGLALTVN